MSNFSWSYRAKPTNPKHLKIKHHYSSPMVRYKIVFEKKDCIGCGACTSQCPENWELVETEDGFKAKLKKQEINEDEYSSNQEAADICPVDCIKIEKVKARKKVVEDFDEDLFEETV